VTFGRIDEALLSLDAATPIKDPTLALRVLDLRSLVLSLQKGENWAARILESCWLPNTSDR
jgi:hypothetical protein